MPPSVREVARKELLEILRDKRSLFVLLLLPVFLYPVLMIGTTVLASAQLEKLQGRTYTVWVEDLAQLPAALRQRLESHVEPEAEVPRDEKASRINLKLEELPADVDVELALTESDVSVVLRGAPGAQAAIDAGGQARLEVLYNGGIDTSSLARRRVQGAIEGWGQEVAAGRISAAGLPKEALRPVLTAAIDRGQPGAMLGRMLAALVVILALTGSFYPATDMGAGEKERGTLETLLLAPVSRVDLALGKVLAVFVVSLVSAFFNLLSLSLTFTWFGGVVGASGGGSLVIDWTLVPVMLVVMIPLIALFSALSLAASTFAASNKEAQAFMTPLLIVGIAPAMITSIPGFELSAAMCLAPVAGPAMLLKELLAGTAGAWQVALVLCSHLVYAVLCLRWVAALYEKEEVLWRPAAAGAPDLLGLQQRKSGAPPEPLPSLPQALILGVVVLLLVAMVGTRVQAWHLTLGLAITLVGLAALPPLAYAKLLGCDLRETFALRAPPLRLLVAVPLLACGGMVINLDVAYATQTAMSPEKAEALKQATSALMSLPLPLLLGLMAVLPAVCEELAFRGFVLHGLAREGGAWTAILMSSLLFAAVHLSAERLLPTFFLGVVLGLMTLRGGSLIPAMLLHATYNGALLTLERVGWEGLQQAPSWGMRVGGLVAFALGVALILSHRPRLADSAPPDPASAG